MFFCGCGYLLSYDTAVPAHVRVQVELRHVVKEASGRQTGSHGPAIVFPMTDERNDLQKCKGERLCLFWRVLNLRWLRPPL